MKTKLEILNDIYRHLVGCGKIKTQQDIAEKIGSVKSNISSAFNDDKRYLTNSLLNRINLAFGSIFNEDWIGTGEGEMLKSSLISHSETENFLLVPLYSHDVVGGMNNQEMDTNGYITGYMPFVNASKDDICVPVTNDSMSPIYEPGTIVQIRKLEYWREFVEFGKVHIIELNDDRRLIKIIRKGDDSTRFVLKSENPKYDDADISIDFIRSIWLVLSKYQKVVM